MDGARGDWNGWSMWRDPIHVFTEYKPLHTVLSLSPCFACEFHMLSVSIHSLIHIEGGGRSVGWLAGWSAAVKVHTLPTHCKYSYSHDMWRTTSERPAGRMKRKLRFLLQCKSNTRSDVFFEWFSILEHKFWFYSSWFWDNSVDEWSVSEISMSGFSSGDSCYSRFEEEAYKVMGEKIRRRWDKESQYSGWLSWVW